MFSSLLACQNFRVRARDRRTTTKAQMRRAAATVYNLQKIRLCANGTVGADAAKPRNRRRNSRLSKDK